MDEKEIRSYLHTTWAGQTLLLLRTVDSTNDEAKRRAETGAEHGFLIVSECQTAGRGRRGRVWESGNTGSIYMSLLLKPDIAPGNASMLTLVMALAVRRALQKAGAGAQIKWPNDVVCGGKKLTGILTEMSMQGESIRYLAIGVGINGNNPSFGGELADRATSVLLQTGKPCDRAALLAEVMNQFEECYSVFAGTEDLSALMEEYNACLVNRGREVKVLDPKKAYTGTALGINARGELQVLTGEGIRAVSSGEVSVRGMYGYV